MIGLSILTALAATTLTAPGPRGPLEGTLIDAGKHAPVAIIIPGSGPTDRDGNNPMGVTAASYRLLAEALAQRGVSTIRTDKRGMFGSKAAIPDANKVTIADYAADAHAWAKVARRATGARCVWLIGHSEGGLIALKAGQNTDDLCGIVTVAGPGRRLGTVMRQQLQANPANAPILTPALHAIDELEAGRLVDAAALPAPLQPLFNPSIQPFVMDLFSYTPTALATSLKLPLLVVNGDQDIQVTVDDARALATAQPKATLVVAKGVTHTLKIVDGEGRAANLATYADASKPVSPVVADAIASFLKAKR
ncbi:MAG: alpha/beta fold hydrolase [Sphingomicrobium sp.]